MNPHFLMRKKIKQRGQRESVRQPVSQCRIKESHRVSREVTTYTCINQYSTYLSFNPELNRVLGVDKKAATYISQFDIDIMMQSARTSGFSKG